MKLFAIAAVVFGSSLSALAQAIPDVTCPVEDLPVKAVVAWQFPEVQKQVQVVVLRDPAGEQEARFDLTHGASLISLRYRGHEMLFGQTAGASVSMFAPSHSKNPELKDVSQYWAAYSPDQGGSSMGIPAVVTGVSCVGNQSMRAFAMMQDRGSDSSFQKRALLGVNAGYVSDHYPAGYATRFSIETNASWIANPGGSPRFYLKLDQSVVNVAPESTGPLEWYLNVAAPWTFEHAASYPEKCLDKTPCSGKDIKALASGRYQDAAQTDGIAMVVPTAGWHSPRTYYQPIAEYVVLLYNAVWAAPRRTFSSVLEQSMEGGSVRRFSWYICAGSWQQARAFADTQPATDTKVDPEPPELTPSPATALANTIACATSDFKPQPNQTDQAVVLHDPAGEQAATFDITQGGALVSLIYGGQEHVWKYNGGGLLQMAFHNHREGAWAGDYNPTQAGDGSANSPVTGIACHPDHTLEFLTSMLDFNHNNGFYPQALAAVWDGRVNDMVPLSYASPYLLETRAEWVPNPKHAPAYYLRLTERLSHVADEKVGPFAFDFASYNPWEFTTRAIYPENCPCAASRIHSIVGGWYQNEKRAVGVAVAMPANNFPNSKVSGGFNSDFMWRNRSFHLGSDELLDGIAAKDFVWYVLPGSWDNAKSFAANLP
jgi:hypothetical protein